MQMTWYKPFYTDYIVWRQLGISFTEEEPIYKVVSTSSSLSIVTAIQKDGSRQMMRDAMRLSVYIILAYTSVETAYAVYNELRVHVAANSADRFLEALQSDRQCLNQANIRFL